ncbi:urease accessory protein UreE [Aliivibrio fischeri]|uniref:urease accessory protein UreE n=1 Tax=Aliivibrio fischeri TaxID=668 RepID=UPI0006D21912|nr:urease accessory protein UreE [Aliivibrio fischeri]USR96131.1 urease accessory protein UreE [Aliivibrio fischeri ATCC 7744 = JCM 18803 = DSM 507]GGK44441.1 urease accessory protein UreE [Aliivibrio fischeri]
MIKFTHLVHHHHDEHHHGEEHTHNTAELTICLTMQERTKSRLKVTLSDGSEAGLFLPRGTVLKEHDIIESDDGVQAMITAAEETVSTVYSDDLLLLAKACYHLGNRHVPLQVEAGWCRYLHDHVLDDMVQRLGLNVKVEQAKYQPEPGAYGGSSAGSHDGHHH